jgi:hypothetical protein
MNVPRILRRFLNGWAKNLSGKYKKEKLLAVIEELDLKAEINPLSASERDANERVNNLRRDEETSGLNGLRLSTCKWEEIILSTSTLLLMGTIGKKKIFQLEQDE